MATLSKSVGSFCECGGTGKGAGGRTQCPKEGEVVAVCVETEDALGFDGVCVERSVEQTVAADEDAPVVGQVRAVERFQPNKAAVIRAITENTGASAPLLLNDTVNGAVRARAYRLRDLRLFARRARAEITQEREA